MATHNMSSPSSWEMGPELRSFLESSNESVFLFEIANDPNVNDTLVFVNKEACDLFGYSRDEIFHLEILSPEYNKPLHNQLNIKEVRNKVIVEGPQLVEWHSKAKDGHLFWAEATIRHFVLGNRDCMLVRARDISEQKQAEKALQESEARNRALLTAIPDVLFLVNNEGVLLDFHYNGLPNLFTLLEDHINRPIQNMLPSPLGEQIVAACNRALETGVIQQMEYRMQGDSPVEYVEARVVRSSEKTVFVMLRDITEGRKLQEQLMVSDRMASVGTLAAGVAHEINNPLAAIMANIELVISKFTKLAPPMSDEEIREIRDDLGDALDAAIRVRHIVNDLRIFSRAQEVRDGPVDIEHLLESSLRMAYNEIRHRAKVVRDFQPVPPVNGNESRLGQVLLNVIVNAAQAIEEGHAEANEIRVATRTDKKGRVVIEISDTGVGMPPEMVRKLFTPFFTTKPVGVGTGLGLVICHRIVDALGGSIEVESTVGKGSTFRILLPPGQEEDFAPSALVWDEHIVPPYQGKVLIVDDEYMLARVLGRTLGGEHQVTIVTRAQEALKKISAGERFDAILCDLMMPEMSGMEFYNEVGRVASDQARQIIFMTGGAFTPRARAFLDEVPNARLQKPFELETLKNLINMQLTEGPSHAYQPRV